MRPRASPQHAATVPSLGPCSVGPFSVLIYRFAVRPRLSVTVRVPIRGSMGKASEHAPDHNSWLVYDALAACVCASCPRFEQGAAGLSVLIMVLFCGYLIPADNIPDWWIWVSVFPLLLLTLLKRRNPPLLSVCLRRQVVSDGHPPVLPALSLLFPRSAHRRTSQLMTALMPLATITQSMYLYLYLA